MGAAAAGADKGTIGLGFNISRYDSTYPGELWILDSRSAPQDNRAEP